MKKQLIKLFLTLIAANVALTSLVGQVKVGIVGSRSDFAISFIKYVAAKDENIKVVAFCPAFSNENTENAGVKISPNTRQVFKDSEIDYVRTTYELIEKVDFVILETNGEMLDFASAFQVIKAKKGLIIQQPNDYELSDIILLFALSKKYQAPMKFFGNRDPTNLLLSSIRSKPTVVSVAGLESQSIASLFNGTDTTYILKNQFTEAPSLFLSTNQGISSLQKDDFDHAKIFDDILSFSRQLFPDRSGNMRKILVSERSDLDRATLVFSLQKSRSQHGTYVHLKDEYQKAFDTAFQKMIRLYN